MHFEEINISKMDVNNKNLKDNDNLLDLNILSSNPNAIDILEKVDESDIIIKDEMITGDNLTINNKCYSIKDDNGKNYYLGKLLKREKLYSKFHDAYSMYNNYFEFENMPKDKKVYQDIHNFHNEKKFTEVII